MKCVPLAAQDKRAGDEQRERGGAVAADDAWPSRPSPRLSVRPPGRTADARIQGQGVLCVGLRGQTDAGGSARLGPAAERARGVQCTLYREV